MPHQFPTVKKHAMRPSKLSRHILGGKSTAEVSTVTEAQMLMICACSIHFNSFIYPPGNQHIPTKALLKMIFLFLKKRAGYLSSLESIYISSFSFIYLQFHCGFGVWLFVEFQLVLCYDPAN